MMHVLTPFGGFLREASALAPYWRHSVRPDNQGLTDLLGEEPRTPLDDAMVATLQSMDSLSNDL